MTAYFDTHALQRPLVRLGITDLSFHRVTGALIAKLLERMGFTVERYYAPHEQNQADMHLVGGGLL